MLSPEMINCIERVRLGFVASVTSGGRPAVSPKGTFVVLDDRTIAFGEIRSPGTLQNISHSPELEVNFVDAFVRKGVRVRGGTQVIRRGTQEFDGLISSWVDLWGDLADRINAIVKVSVEAAKPLSTPPYDDGVTEDEMIAIYKTKYAEMYP